MTIVARAAGDPAPLAIAMRRAGVAGAQTMVKSLGLIRARESTAFLAKLFSLFAVLGLGLAAFGVYGVVAHSVAERRRELGVRIALGATPGDILHAVLRENVVIGLLGIALGLAATKYGALLLQGSAPGGDVFGATLFAGAAVFMFGVAAVSAFVPARRATKIDPTESLRSE